MVWYCFMIYFVVFHDWWCIRERFWTLIKIKLVMWHQVNLSVKSFLVAKVLQCFDSYLYNVPGISDSRTFREIFARWNYGLNFCRNFYLLSFEALKTGYSLQDTIMPFFGKKYFRYVNHNGALLHSKTFQRKFWLFNFDNLVFC